MKEYQSVGADNIIGYTWERYVGGPVCCFELRILGFCSGAILAIRTADGIIKTYSHVNSRKPDEEEGKIMKGKY